MSSHTKLLCAYSLVLVSFLGLIISYTFYPSIYLLTAVGITLGCSIIVLFYLTHALFVAPQARLSHKLDALKAGGNDLSHHDIDLKHLKPSPLELAFNDFLSQVHDSISNLKTVAQRLAQLSNQVANQSQDSQSAIKQQQSHLQFAHETVADSQFTFQYLSSHLQKTRKLNQDNLDQGLANQQCSQQQIEKTLELKNQADEINQASLAFSATLSEVLQHNHELKYQNQMAKAATFNASIVATRERDKEKAYLILSNDVAQLIEAASLQAQLIEQQLGLLLDQSQLLAQQSLDLRQHGHELNNLQQHSILSGQELLDKQQQLESIHQKVYQTLSQQSQNSAQLSDKLTQVSNQFDHNADAFDHISGVGDLLVDCADKLDKDLQQFNVTGTHEPHEPSATAEAQALNTHSSKLKQRLAVATQTNPAPTQLQ